MFTCLWGVSETLQKVTQQLVKYQLSSCYFAEVEVLDEGTGEYFDKDFNDEVREDDEEQELIVEDAAADAASFAEKVLLCTTKWGCQFKGHSRTYFSPLQYSPISSKGK